MQRILKLIETFQNIFKQNNCGAALQAKQSHKSPQTDTQLMLLKRTY